MKRIHTLLVLGFVLAGTISPGWAVPKGEKGRAPSLKREDRTAEAHYIAAIDFFKKGDYEQAARLFLEAYKKSGKPHLLYNVGVCYERMGLLRRALEYYEKFFEFYPEERPKLQSHLDHLRERIAKTALEIAGGVPGAVVTVDGSKVCTLPCGRIHVVPNEDHVVRVEAEGYVPFEVKVRPAAGALQRIVVTMVRVRPAPVASPSGARGTPRKTDGSSSWWPVVFGSGAAVLAIAAGTFGYVALGYADDYSRTLAPEDEDRARAFAMASDGATVGAVVLGAVALYQWLGGSR